MTTKTKPDPKGFNRRVRAWVKEKYKGNVSEAARQSGVPRNSLWQITKGLTQTPNSTILVQLSRAMGISIDELITGAANGEGER